MEVILVALAAAHEGEEFVIALPAVMLAGAFFLMRWANQGAEELVAGRLAALDETADGVTSVDGFRPCAEAFVRIDSR